jgi:25S rRNA (adenine2142-N1)-methyltransferase
VISLSLVLNFVPTPQGRYDMLLRTTQFLRISDHSIFPALFVVLPLPCVENSRYVTREHFLDIMSSLGYTVSQSKESKRIAYWLFHWNGTVKEKEWKKKVIKEGGGRNNFAISN